MHCQSCGKEIDDKAIVCYRCGEPTAVPVPVARVAGGTPSGRPRWGVIPIVAVIVALGTLLLPMTPPDSIWRAVGFGVVALVTFVSIRIYAGGRLRRRRHRID